MTTPLLSPDWYRVAFLRPQLRAGLRVGQQLLRGQLWRVVTDPVSGQHHRFNQQAWQLVAACDGQQTLDELWSARVAADAQTAPTQADALRVVTQAFAANLFVGDVAPDAAAMVKAERRVRARKRKAAINPLAFRVRLWNPDAWLDQHAHLLRPCFGAPGLRVAAVLLLLALAVLLVNADALARDAQHQFSHGRLLLVGWLVYPLMKLLHEAAHAFAVKAYGGNVPSVGLTLLMLTPVPFVDASASAAFDAKRQRAVVAAAGIAVEWLLAGAACGLWLLLQPGLAREVALSVVVVGTVSTLLVNANPLLRLDGYHLLCDLAELPDLASRSQRWWRHWLTALLTHTRRTPVPPLPGLLPGELPWLVAYAPLSQACTAALVLLFALALAQASVWLGLAVLAIALWTFVLAPCGRALRWLLVAPALGGHRSRAVTLLLAGGLAMSVGLLAVSLPQRSVAPGLVWLPDDAEVHAGSEGFIQAVLVHDGDMVQPGTALLRLANDALLREHQHAQHALAQQHVMQGRLFADDALASAQALDRIAQLQADEAGLHQRVDALVLRAALAGRVVLDHRRQVVGAFVEQGQVVAQVLPAGPPLVRAFVANDDIALVRARPGAVQVVLGQGGDPLPASAAGAVPLASKALASAALGDAAGGAIALDPADASGRTANEPRFQFDLRLPDGAPAAIGARVLVRFQHGDASAAELAAAALRKAFLRHFVR